MRRSKSFWKYLVIPLSLVLVPIVFLYARNTDIVAFGEIVRITSFSLFLTALIFILFSFLFKDFKKASFSLSFIILVSFLFGHFSRLIPYFELFKVDGFIIGRNALLLICTILLIAGVMIYVRKTNKNLSTYLRWFFLLSLFLNLFNIGLIANSLTFDKHDVNLPLRMNVHLANSKLNYVPDIYYIILDGHAREDVLREVFKYSNRGFIKDLESKGFYVSKKSRANYIYTFASLGSSLNYDYLDELLKGKYRRGENNSKVLTEIIAGNKAARRLKSLGYQYIIFDSGFSGTENSPLADIKYEYAHGLNNFEFSLVSTNIFSRLLYFLKIDTNTYHRERVRFIFSQLKYIPSLDQPTFTFAHIISPHPPFVFNEDGSFPFSNLQFSLADGGMYRGTYEQYKRGYLEQLKYIDKLVSQTVAEILSNSENPPIIIIQSDHGSATEAKKKPGPKTDFLSSYVEPKNPVSLKERTSILNAYYFPGVSHDIFYPTITPVNSFRLLFNTYFGANFDLLEDKTFWDR